MTSLERKTRSNARVASAFANLGKSWCPVQDAKREILGKPKAGVPKPETEAPDAAAKELGINPAP